jgi:DNA-binding beta-propeller fold protein YncE
MLGGIAFLSLALLNAGAADIPPLRTLGETGLAPTGIFVDTVNNEVAVVDDGQDKIVIFSRTAIGLVGPIRTIQGLNTGLDHPEGVFIDTVNNKMFVANQGQSITVYNRTANGNVFPLQNISGDGTTLDRPWGIAVDLVNNEIVVSNERGHSVTVFPGDGDGEIAPLRTIQGPSTGLFTNDPKGVFVDTVNNEIGVAVQLTGSINIYPRMANGNVAPIRVIQGPLTGFNLPHAIFLDSVAGEIAVANFTADSLSFFPRLANGNVAPLRTITGALTGLTRPSGIFVDTVNNEVAVTNYGSHRIAFFQRGVNGNVAPLRTIAGAADNVYVGFDDAGNATVDTVNNEIGISSCVSHYSVKFYPRTANGHIAPLRTIEGNNTGLARSLGLAFDPVNNEIAVANGINGSVTFYSRLANGNVAPLRTIQGPNTGLVDRVSAVFIDPVNNEVAVAEDLNDTIRIFSRLANGNVAPLRVIAGPNTGLAGPRGVWTDTVNNEIVVSNGRRLLESITVYPRLANGDVVPIRTIAGANTLLTRNRHIVADTLNNEIVVANRGAGRVNFYSRTANGNVAPLRTIEGPMSQLQGTRALYVDTVNNEVGVGDPPTNLFRIFPRLF